MKEKLNTAMERVTLKQLRALGAVVRTGTISQAAKELSVTPPAVSMQMRLLAETVGLPVVERTGSRLRPTDAGLVVLDGVRRCESALAACGEALEEMKGAGGGRVKVGVVSTAKYFAPHALAAFARAHPKIEMRLSVGNRGETIEALRGYDLDFAVMGRPPGGIEVESAVIGNHPHIIVAPPGHPMAGRRDIAFADLAGETFLLREDGSGTRALMQRLFDEAGLNPNLGMEIGSNETIKQAVIAGLGIAMISAHTVGAELQDGRLRELDVTGLPVMRQWFTVKLEKKRLLPAARAFWDFLVDSGTKYLPEANSRR